MHTQQYSNVVSILQGIFNPSDLVKEAKALENEVQRICTKWIALNSKLNSILYPEKI